MNVTNNSWDIKSKTYNKFDGKLNEFQIRFFDALKNFNVNFNDKTLVDIGCGTGVYTLYLSKFCKEILGIDSSSKMLEELNKKAFEFKITNVSTQNVSFDDFKPNNKFDIAFLTMSPALRTKSDFEKFINLGDLRIYLNWYEPRFSSLLEPFFKKYGKNTLTNISSMLKSYLEISKIPFQVAILEEERTQKRTFEEAYENTLWHLDINSLKFDKNEVRDMISSMSNNGVIEDNIKSKMQLLVF